MTPQEYTLVKLRLTTLPESLSAVCSEASSFALLAATLRPETMAGQTNVWLLPHDSKVRVAREFFSNCDGERHKAALVPGVTACSIA